MAQSIQHSQQESPADTIAALLQALQCLWVFPGTLAALADLSIRQVTYWRDKGILACEDSSGISKFYFEAFLLALWIGDYLKKGYSLEAAAGKANEKVGKHLLPEDWKIAQEDGRDFQSEAAKREIVLLEESGFFLSRKEAVELSIWVAERIDSETHGENLDERSPGLQIGEASRLCGLSIRQLSYWTDKGLVESTAMLNESLTAAEEESIHAKRYDSLNIVKAMLVKEIGGIKQAQKLGSESINPQKVIDAWREELKNLLAPKPVEPEQFSPSDTALSFPRRITAIFPTVYTVVTETQILQILPEKAKTLSCLEQMRAQRIIMRAPYSGSTVYRLIPGYEPNLLRLEGMIATTM